MRYILISLISLISIFPLIGVASDDQAFCLSEPAVTIDYYLMDYSGGAESSDDSSFEGSINCDKKTLVGKFSYGNDSGRLYWFETSAVKWMFVY